MPNPILIVFPHSFRRNGSFRRSFQIDQRTLSSDTPTITSHLVVSANHPMARNRNGDFV
jgi:hypothetical protein